jgi:glyoxylase-like metal-dependent hydrolase (beta-lactamase superfamily II)
MTFDDRMQMHFNGEQIDLLHAGPAHTAGDAVVVFREHNVVHMGDVYNNAGYPFIDADNGGDLNGMIEFCKTVIRELNEDTIVVPGHGPVVGYENLVGYVEMLATIRDRIAGLIAEGATLEEVIAARPTAEFDEAMGDSVDMRFINRAYTSLYKHELGSDLDN